MNCESCLIPVMMMKHKSQATDYSDFSKESKGNSEVQCGSKAQCNEFLLKGRCGYKVHVLDLEAAVMPTLLLVFFTLNINLSTYNR